MPTQYTKACAHCQREFAAKHRTQACCGRSCAGVMRRARPGHASWRKAEVDLLERYCGALPFPDLVKRLHELCDRRGWPRRSQSAITSYMAKRGYSRACRFDHFTGPELARVLGVPTYQVRTWQRWSKLPYRKVSRTRIAINIAELREWISETPHYFADVERENLLWLFSDDTELVDRIKASQKPSFTPIAVRRLDTGETYPSLKRAAKENFLHPTTLALAIRQGRRVVGGIEWEVLHEQC